MEKLELGPASRGSKVRHGTTTSALRARRKPSKHHDAAAVGLALELRQRISDASEGSLNLSVWIKLLAISRTRPVASVWISSGLPPYDLSGKIPTDCRNGSTAALDDHVVSRDRDAKISRETISRAVDGRDATGVQQMQNERAIIFQDRPFRRLASDKSGAIREKIESAVRFQAVEARNRIEHPESEISAASIDRNTRRNEILRSGDRGERRELTYRSGTRRTLRLQHVDGVDDGLGTGPVTNAPTCHGIGLGDTIDDKDPVSEIGHSLHQTRRGLPLEPDLIIDLVGQHADMGVTAQHFRERTQLGRVVGDTGRISGRVQHQPASSRCHRYLELGGSELERLLLLASDDDRSTVIGKHHIGIGHPIGCGDDDLATWIKRRHQRQKDYLLAAATDRDPVRGIGHTGALRHLGSDCLAEGSNAIGRRVLRFPARDRVDRSLFNMGRCVEIRLAYRQIEDGTPLRFQVADTL